MQKSPLFCLVASLIISVGCADAENTSTTTTTTTTTDTGFEPSDGQALIEADCTSSCHAGQDMGELSVRYPSDDDLATVISGDGGGPMSGNTASEDWSSDDLDSAIAHLRTLEN